MFRFIGKEVRNILKWGRVPSGRRSAYDNYKEGETPWVVSMDDIPQPEGSWQEDYDARQKKYNRHLAAGVTSFLAALIGGIVSGHLVAGWGPPELLFYKPAEPPVPPEKDIEDPC